MSLYIIRPKARSAFHAIPLMSRRLAPKNRMDQLQQMADIWREDEGIRSANAWLADAGHGVGSAGAPATGSMLADLSEEEAGRMQRELPGMDIIRDRPLSLIQPERQTLGKEKLYRGDLWHLSAIGLGEKRKGANGWTGKGVAVAVLDTGINQAHPDLAGKVLGAVKFDTKKGQAVSNAKPTDTDGHGTHVAGLICGEKTGVAPGAVVFDALMLPKGYGYLSDFVMALEWASKQPEIQIINMSAGLDGYIPELQSIMTDLVYVGLLPVCAVGNDGRNKTCSPGNYIEGLSVGATNRRKRVSAFSGGGTIVAGHHQYLVPDLVAPGEIVWSCSNSGGYESMSGTSMATPVVSGIAALILEKHPDIPVDALTDMILSWCKDLEEPAERQGRGLVQVRITD